MDFRLLTYNKRRQQSRRSRRWRYRSTLLKAYYRRGAMAALARRLDVHRSTILKDCRAVWTAVITGRLHE